MPLDHSASSLLVSRGRHVPVKGSYRDLIIRRYPMAWTRPKLREICIGMEINGYFAGKM